MCGIVGILGQGAVAPQIVAALKRLEYRGYDLAGVATLEGGRVTRLRAEGKLKNLEAKLERAPLSGRIGIGHTRWATHGKPTERNAHPHASDRLAVVHNGIIENFKSLREELAAKGHRFATETDSEVAAFLVTDEMAAGKPPAEAVHAALKRMRGAFALVYLFDGEEDLLDRRATGRAARGRLWRGRGGGGDVPGLRRAGARPVHRPRRLSRGGRLGHGDARGREIPGHVGPAGQAARDPEPGGRIARRKGQLPPLHGQGNPRTARSRRPHDRPLRRHGRAAPEAFPWPVDAAALTRVSIVACGTAYMAGLIGKYWIERLARLPVEVDVASEYRYREPPVDKGGLTILISQSGETADTLASMRYASEQGSKTLAVVNVPTSSIARLADASAPTLAGPEIGVASTKAFTCQLAAMACLAMGLARARGVLTEAKESELVGELIATPGLLAEALKLEPALEQIAHKLARARDVLYLGRGPAYPLALEGALKLKELSYIHAEGYAAGELKHGPIALIDEAMPVIVIAPRDAVFEKTVSNMQEVAARGGRIILIGEPHAAEEAAVALESFLAMPDMGAAFAPIVYAAPVQMLAYHTAVIMGKDADQPRNLAKSVTVE